jgi:hypothetical protein
MYNEGMSDIELRRLAKMASLEPTMENLAKLGAAYLRSIEPPPPELQIVGRRWFSRTHGNTYHTVAVFLDGEPLGHTEDMVYGYGDQYRWTGLLLAIKNSDLPPMLEGEPPWQYADRVGIKIEYSVTDGLKRDLWF